MSLIFKKCPIGQEMLLGSPLRESEVDEALNRQAYNLGQFVARLPALSIHKEFFLLLHSLTIPRLMLLLSSAPCFILDPLANFDKELWHSLIAISNCEFPDVA